jgi:hypothetical protein
MAMPANDYITLPVGGNAVYLRYTAPADGYFFFSTGQNSYVAGNVDDPGGNDLYSFIKYSPNSNGAFAAIFIPVRKGNIVSYGRGNVGGTARFFSAIGALGEA